MTHLLAVGLGYCGRALIAAAPHLFTRITGTSRFNARIEREKVRLEGDLVDDANDLADLPG